MNEISNDVIKHCQALASLTRLTQPYNNKIISFTIMRGKTEILLLNSPSDELLAKCQNITKEEREYTSGRAIRCTAKYSHDIELLWFEERMDNDEIS